MEPLPSFRAFALSPWLRSFQSFNAADDTEAPCGPDMWGRWDHGVQVARRLCGAGRKRLPHACEGAASPTPAMRPLHSRNPLRTSRSVTSLPPALSVFPRSTTDHSRRDRFSGPRARWSSAMPTPVWKPPLGDESSMYSSAFQGMRTGGSTRGLRFGYPLHPGVPRGIWDARLGAGAGSTGRSTWAREVPD